MSPHWEMDVAVMGGCGHVGLPLGLVLADAGLQVVLYDTDVTALDHVRAGKVPHLEPGAERLLANALEGGRLTTSTDPASLGRAEHVVVAVDTPLDGQLRPNPESVSTALHEVGHHLVDGQLLVIRSTVFPGVTRAIERFVAELGVKVDVAVCPERIAEGAAMEELRTLPQIIAARTDRVAERAAGLFAHLGGRIVRLSPEEAELAKLFTNSYRYVKFAAANQFFMMANDAGLDYERIRAAVVEDYPRAADLPAAGFTAGPCLLKDTMQLAFSSNNFALGMGSMQINEGLPQYLVSRMSARYELGDQTVGILGMAYKAESDDIRSSLSYKLAVLLRMRAAAVLTTDPYVPSDDALLPLEHVLDHADLIVIGAPHKRYADIEIRQPVVDIWNIRGNGVSL